MVPLDDEDLQWIVERIRAHRLSLEQHPGWRARILDGVGVLVWAASVDGRDGEHVRKDGWIASGGALREAHFTRAPATVKARNAFRRGNLTEIKREHAVPRAKLRDILLEVTDLAQSLRILKAYSVVALVHDSELRHIRPASSMPQAWDAHVDWRRAPPAVLPSPWARYWSTNTVVRPLLPDGTPVFRA